MPLTKNELAMLRKQYPAAHYEIREEGGKLEIVPKKCVIRIFKKQLKRINTSLVGNDTVGDAIVYRINNSKLLPEDFEQAQVTVEKKVADRLTEEAKKCRTRKIIYLQQLLGGIK